MVNLNKDWFIERNGDYVTFCTYRKKNRKEENIVIEISECNSDFKDKKSLAYLWYKNGYTDKKLTNYLSVKTYCRDKKGNCLGKYNPQTKKEGKRNVINFDWMLENTKENKEKLINEVIRLFKESN